MHLLRLVTGLLITVPALLPAQNSGPLQPTSKWIVTYADDLCTLQRNFVAAGEPMALVFQPEVMGHGHQLIVIKGGRMASISGRKVRLAADGKDIPIAAKSYSVVLQDNGLSRNGFDMTKQEVEQTRHASVLSVDVGSGLRFQFAVPGLSKALVALEACRSDLVSGWGMSPVQQQALAVPAVPLRKLESYLSSEDYPSSAVGTSGKARVRLTISEAGRVRQCMVVHSTGDKALDTASCTSLQNRARFKPALDKAGVPMSSFHVVEIAWLWQ